MHAQINFCRLLIAAMGGLALSGGVTPARAQQATIPSLSGAWVEQGVECDKVFVSKGGRLVFRKPVDAFTSAFLVSGPQVIGPEASCRIVGTKAHGDRTVLFLGCATSVALGRTATIVKLGSDGFLYRYFDSADLVGDRYQRCAAK